MQLINPSGEIRIFAQTDLIIKDLYFDFEISKDLTEEPNKAAITIYNLNDETRNEILNPSQQDIPIEIHLTKRQSTELILAYAGNIESVENNFLRPGYQTVLNCLSQKENHRSKFVENQTYKKGTSYKQIVEDFVKIINLPSQIGHCPETGILLAQTFNGSAFGLLRSFCRDFGMQCSICDGILYIWSRFEPTSTTVTISQNELLEKPRKTEIQDSEYCELRTITEITEIVPPKKKKKTKRQKIIDTYSRKSNEDSLGDYVEYDTVEKNLEGLDLVLFCQPEIIPDNMISLSDIPEYKDKQYRVREVTHSGNNYGGDWQTLLGTELSEES
jgi:hypothetical protein